MKTMRTLISIALCLLSISVYAQEPPIRTQNQNIRINNSNPFILLLTDTVAKQSEVNAVNTKIPFDSARISGSEIVFYYDGSELFAFDTTEIYAKIALMAADSFHISGSNIYAFKGGDTLIYADPPSAIVDLDDISAGIHAIFQNDSTTFTARNEVAFWEESTQRYPDITGINYYMPAHWELLGSDVKAIPLGSEMYVGGGLALADGEEFFMTYYLYDTTVITGARVTLSVQGDYTADNYNGIALYSNSTSGIVLIDSTLNGAGDIWKAAAGATVDSTFAAGPHTLAPGLYTVSVIYNQSAQTAAPVVVGRSTLITTTQRFAFANDRKLTGRVTSRTAPADIVHSSITSYSYCVQVVLY